MSIAQPDIETLEMTDTPPHPGRRLTEAEFVEWCTDSTWAEWVDGEVILMSPVNFEHAELFRFLLSVVGTYIDDRDLGTVLTEPFQIRFGRMRRRRSPDIIFISRERSEIIKYAHIEGAPDLVIEIVSPDSQSRDRREKYLEYQSAGVREYWIIDPLSKTVEAHSLTRGRYGQIAKVDDRIPSSVLSGFYLKPQWLWRAKLPKVSEVLRELSAKPRRSRRRRS